MALTCRYYGISRQASYNLAPPLAWLGWAAAPVEGPLNCPYESSSEVVRKIIHLRQNSHFGPAKIYLKCVTTTSRSATPA